jgi:hypothetical protein
MKKKNKGLENTPVQRRLLEDDELIAWGETDTRLFPSSHDTPDLAVRLENLLVASPDAAAPSPTRPSSDDDDASSVTSGSSHSSGSRYHSSDGTCDSYWVFNGECGRALQARKLEEEKRQKQIRAAKRRNKRLRKQTPYQKAVRAFDTQVSFRRPSCRTARFAAWRVSTSRRFARSRF